MNLDYYIHQMKVYQKLDKQLIVIIKIVIKEINLQNQL